MDTSTYSLFLKSVVIGLSIAAPVGPIGLLTIQRALNGGFAAGFATGAGAALADAVYGAVGAFGVTWLIDALAGIRVPLAIGGGILLLWLAWKTWRAPLSKAAAEATGGGDLFRCVAGTFLLTLSNPATILSFIAVFGALSGSATVIVSPLPMVLGVLAGSMLWWLLLASAVSWSRRRFSDDMRRHINAASAAVLAAFAVWQFSSIL